jgi:hypothetical protein
MRSGAVSISAEGKNAIDADSADPVTENQIGTEAATVEGPSID